MTSTTPLQNHAAWLTAPKAHPLQIKPAPLPTPLPTEILIRVHSIAINPVDALIQTAALPLVQSYPTILGIDCAGTVILTGSAVSRFHPGDRVFGAADVQHAFDRGARAFQEYCLLPDKMTATLPGGVGFNEGAVLPLGFCTAVVPLFDADRMGLETPGLGGREGEGGKGVVLVYGASSSVGVNAVQLCVAAGYEVVATCSERNFGLVRDAGAKSVWDYRVEGWEEEVERTVKESGLRFCGVYDAIITGESILTCAKLAKKVAIDEQGLKIGTVLAPGMPLPDDLPEGIHATVCPGVTDAKDEDAGPRLWREWMTPALEKGLLRPLPKPEVVGKGLESIQKALDQWSAGISGTKLVVEIV